MPDLLSVTEAAARLNVSIRRVQQLISSGVLPAVRIADVWAINPDDLPAAEGRNRKPGPAKGSTHSNKEVQP